MLESNSRRVPIFDLLAGPNNPMPCVHDTRPTVKYDRDTQNQHRAPMQEYTRQKMESMLVIISEMENYEIHSDF